MLPIVAVAAKVLAATFAAGAAVGASAGALAGSRFPEATTRVARSGLWIIGKAGKALTNVSSAFSHDGKHSR